MDEFKLLIGIYPVLSIDCYRQEYDPSLSMLNKAVDKCISVYLLPF